MRFLVFIFISILVLSCARQGSPTGGPKDETPPKFIGSSPDTLSLNVPTNLKEIRINFDEYIVLKDHTQQIVVSPPLESGAVYMPVGTARKYVSIKLEKPLEENTTYNINFGTSIQDNNEGNKLPYFQYVFSTGDYVDSLELTGKASVLSEKKLSDKLLVALFKVDSTYNDSAILKQKPFYVSRLDAEGNFKLNYLRPGKYQMVAFDDVVQNMQFDIGEEKFGFMDELIDLNENQTAEIQLFDQIPPYKAGKAEQRGYGHMVFKFAGQPENIEITPVDFDFTTSKISYKPKSDSLNFWFKPSVDSIYEKSKRLKFLVKHKDKSDTISAVYSNSQKHSLSIKELNKGNYTPSKKVKITVNYPITKLDSSYISVRKDTVDLPFKIIPDTKNENAFMLDFKIELASAYEVNLLPNAITDFFEETNDSIKISFKTKTRNDFGNLRLSLQNKPDKPFWIQLLNNKDEVLEEIYTTKDVFDFNHLNPGEYYFKILIDENENEHWDTGDFFAKKQPEKAMIYPAVLNVRAMWDLDEVWVLPEPNSLIKEESSTEVSEDSK
ncbi:Ig-like domain-containing protein [Moheibacter sediminis]|uniref:Ig-like domain-containing protein n=1 Tax=Moheibacter sediminis TaxID=1434700 RepID=A0A1W1Y9A1_9FLAO|nr:Ig-like domain-containing protein [Moheibacter sediminis]SMC32737.1 Ig-like domain-containing protein [Moheibacter sediminis]